MAKYLVVFVRCFLVCKASCRGLPLEQSLTGHQFQVSESDSYKNADGVGSPPAEVRSLPTGLAKRNLRLPRTDQRIPDRRVRHRPLEGRSSARLEQGRLVYFFFAKFYPWVYHQNPVGSTPVKKEPTELGSISNASAGFGRTEDLPLSLPA